MIVYDLGCKHGHHFEGWFSSGDDFESQRDGKLLSCPMCGSIEVARLPHAPHVNTGAVERKLPAKANAAAVAQQYANLGDEVLTKLIEHIVEHTEDVGRAFPEEARKIHYHESPERHIRGTASPREVEALRDEGIDVVAVPVPPHRAGTRH
jgi:hypothetical protein